MLAQEKKHSEVWLVSEDNGAWGLDRNETFPDLLRAIVDLAPTLRIRIGMMNAQYVRTYAKELAELLKHDCFYTFIHIPIQAASNTVLKDMNRFYTIEEFEESAQQLRKELPDITIMTDIICGYPTETQDDWNQTMNFLKSFQFNAINISKFYPRSNTPAAKLSLLPTHHVKERSKELTQWFATQNYNEHYVGTTVLATFVEYKEGTLIGHTKNYRQVIVRGDKEFLGTTKNVKIESVTRDDLRGIFV